MTPRMMQHRFDESVKVEARGMPRVVEFLRNRPNTIDVLPATDTQQREQDIDLVWLRNKHTSQFSKDVYETTVEVKVDAQGHRTGNLFFEMVSNELYCTTGCFMMTEATLFIYYFVESGELLLMKVEDVRNWYGNQLSTRPHTRDGGQRFQPVYLENRVGDNYYTTFGRLVPREEILAGLGVGNKIHQFFLDGAPTQRNIV